MRLKIYCRGLFLIIFAIIFNAMPVSAVEMTEGSSIVKEERLEQRRKRKPRRKEKTQKKTFA